MTRSRKDIEILAPAGNFESLMAALQAQADAVYFGVGRLNMRHWAAKNFSTADLPKITEACHKHGAHSYLAVNTIVYDEEITQVQELIRLARDSDVDAIIASDVAVMQTARTLGIPAHISTQANISNLEAVKFYARYGDVMVLARELTLDQISAINRGINDQNITGPSGKTVRTEVFIHGAMCMAVSGRCYLSLHQNQHSANRGECFQICRRSYVVKDKETDRELEIDNQYILSPKDMSTVHFLNKILDAGVSVLKIEGRARAPEYVKTVLQCYREALDSIFDGSYTEAEITLWQERLATVFNRGFWDGYYRGARLPEWSSQYGSQATQRKTYIAKGVNYYKKIKVAEFVIETHSLKIGDHILIIGPTTGVVEHTISEMLIDGKSVKTARKGDDITLPLETLIRLNDKLYKVTERAQDT